MSDNQGAPGWYPQNDGTQRYWDGQQWTQTAPGGALAQQVAPKKKGIPAWGWILIVLGALVLICGGGGIVMLGVGGKAASDAIASAAASATAPVGSGGVAQGYGSKDASGDVTLGAAEPPDAIGAIYVPVTATNSSEKRSDYYIDVSAESADGKTAYSTSSTFINNVEPGQTGQGKLLFSSSSTPADAVYKVKQVSRTAATN